MIIKARGGKWAHTPSNRHRRYNTIVLATARKPAVWLCHTHRSFRSEKTSGIRICIYNVCWSIHWEPLCCWASAAATRRIDRDFSPAAAVSWKHTEREKVKRLHERPRLASAPNPLAFLPTLGNSFPPPSTCSLVAAVDGLHIVPKNFPSSIRAVPNNGHLKLFSDCDIADSSLVFIIVSCVSF
jgi:hypothetical protein